MSLPQSEMRLDRAFPDLFTAEEAATLAALASSTQFYGSRERVVRAGVPLDSSIYLASGFMGRFACDRFGRRQFVGLQIPGDYVDLPAYILKHLDHEIESLGPVTITRTSHADLDRITEARPELCRKLWHVTMIDCSIHRYWTFRTGRLAGKARVANFFCEMFLRLFERGLAEPTGYGLPISQADLGEICGVTPVHVNRLLAELRLDNVCLFTGGRVEILDLQRLFHLGEHSRDYLYLPAATGAALAPLLGQRRSRSA